MPDWQDDCGESVGHYECHGQIVRDQSVGANKSKNCHCPVGQPQTHKPLGEKNWHTNVKIGEDSIDQSL
jgi:hypothetical protein